VVKGPAAQATDAPQPEGLLCNPVMKMKRKIISFFIFPSNGAQGQPEILGGKTCPSATLSTTNPTWTDTGSNPGLRGERPAANRLSHGTAKMSVLISSKIMLSSLVPRHIKIKIYTAIILPVFVWA
jgi:hypothetical protein